MLHRRPIPCPRRWPELVNEPQTDGELDALPRSVNRGQPNGHPAWVQKTAAELGLESTMRKRGRPHKIPPQPESTNLSNMSRFFPCSDIVSIAGKALNGYKWLGNFGPQLANSWVGTFKQGIEQC